MQFDPVMAVEWALVAHPAVVEAAALGEPETLRAPVRVYIVLQPGQRDDDAQRAALLAHVQQQMGEDAPPLEILFTESLPKTRTGKVARWMLGG